MSANRREFAKRKAADFYRDSREMQRMGLAYFVLFTLLMILVSPFLLFELAVYLLTGRDIGWFPVSEDREQPVAQVVTTAAVLGMMETLNKPGLHLVGTGRDVRSRIGGAPDLPDGFEWPQWNNAPLAFLAQIDLAEIGQQSILPDLPKHGLLHFFYDQEQSTWGFNPDDRGSWRVFYTANGVQCSRTDAPAGATVYAGFVEKRLESREITTYPSVDRLSEQPMQMSDETWDAVDAHQAGPFADLPRHQIGGLPIPVQGDDMELECQLASNGVSVGDSVGYTGPEAEALKPGAADWALLLQLDTDDDAGMMWGDVGVLYFWIRKADLKAQNFSDCWMVLQCS